MYHTKIGIIDIGYNAIRAIAYDNLSVGINEIFKYHAKTSVHNIVVDDNMQNKHHVYLNLEYILHIFKKLNVENIIAVATASLRAHKDSDRFINYVKKRFNLKIDIISGSREAYLAALGVISGIKHAEGIVIDLGGGSLEIVEIYRQKVGNRCSLPLGTKILQQNTQNHDVKYIQDQIKENFYENDELVYENKYQNDYQTIYFIGGALRRIGKDFIKFNKYPITDLHNLEIKKQDLLAFLDKISNNQFGTYTHHRISYETALIVKSVLQLFSPKNIVFSAFGLKEGVRFELISNSEKSKNDLFERLYKLSGYKINEVKIENYLTILENIIPYNDYKTRDIFEFALMLIRLIIEITPNPSENLIIQYILNIKMPITHRLRLMLTVIILHSFGYDINSHLHKTINIILRGQVYDISKILGYFMFITMTVDGPDFMIPSFNIEIEHNNLKIRTQNILPSILFHKTQRVLKIMNFLRKKLQRQNQ